MIPTLPDRREIQSLCLRKHLAHIFIQPAHCVHILRQTPFEISRYFYAKHSVRMTRKREMKIFIVILHVPSAGIMAHQNFKIF
jgi:hypothetical protein